MPCSWARLVWPVVPSRVKWISHFHSSLETHERKLTFVPTLGSGPFTLAQQKPGISGIYRVHLNASGASSPLQICWFTSVISDS